MSCPGRTLGAADVLLYASKRHQLVAIRTKHVHSVGLDAVAVAILDSLVPVHHHDIGHNFLAPWLAPSDQQPLRGGAVIPGQVSPNTKVFVDLDALALVYRYCEIHRSPSFRLDLSSTVVIVMPTWRALRRASRTIKPSSARRFESSLMRHYVASN